MNNKYLPIIEIIEDDYEIPQLGRRRRISALLPYDYEETDRQYPVLYLHDGQNLFRDNSLVQNWAIDHGLATLAEEGFKDLIIIAIDHGGEERVTEYSPYYNPRFGDGDGEKYLDFLINTLKPYVDKKFRVLTEREHTGIGGSSMGGLISLYAGMKYKDIFGKLMIFSPSLWISPKLYYDSSRFLVTEKTDLYVYAGEKESKNHIANVNRLKSSIFRTGTDQSALRFHQSIEPEGTHNEKYWRAEFPQAIKWLFFTDNSDAPSLKVQAIDTLADYEVLVLPFWEQKIDQALIENLAGRPSPDDFQAREGETVFIYPTGTNKKICLLGLGKEEHMYRASRHFRRFAFQHHEKWHNSLSIYLSHLPDQVIFEAVLGTRLAMYHPGLFKTNPHLDPFQEGELTLDLIHTAETASELIGEARHTGDTQTQMMKLVNLPANIKTPAYMASYAQKSAELHGYQVNILNKEELNHRGFEAVLAVGKGSEHEPILIELEYKPEGHESEQPDLGLVGKGITFDTGGVSMKRPTNMHYMKSDMGGAVAVMGAIELAAKLKLDVHLVGIIPVAENSVDAASLKPGDVIGSFSGKNIEVIDTDAEGRLILADGLAYVQEKYGPQTIIDLATLTGSCVQALGYAAGGLFTPSDTLAQNLMTVGDHVHERLWRLPLYKDFEAELESDIADVKNYSGKPIAGAIFAAKFLEYFIKDHPQWAHLDIAGMAFGDSEFTKMKAATGYGIRLLIEYMKRFI